VKKSGQRQEKGQRFPEKKDQKSPREKSKEVRDKRGSNETVVDAHRSVVDGGGKGN